MCSAVRSIQHFPALSTFRYSLIIILRGDIMHRKRILSWLVTLTAVITTVFITAAAAPAAAGPVSPQVTSCTGSFRYDAYNNTGNDEAHLYGWFWSSTGQVCVGQADLYETVTTSTGLQERVRVHDGSSSGTVLETYKSGGTISGNSITFVTHVSRVFFVSVVTVCVAVIHKSDGSVVPNTTVCKSL
jgi:hypothetical protein